MMKIVFVTAVTTFIWKSYWLKIKVQCLFYHVVLISSISCEWFQPHPSWELCVFSILFFQYLQYATTLPALPCDSWNTIYLWWESLSISPCFGALLWILHGDNNISSILEVKSALGLRLHELYYIGRTSCICLVSFGSSGCSNNVCFQPCYFVN
jgi:hypothetical protein